MPVDPDGADLGPTARAVMPFFAQLFVAETMAGPRRRDAPSAAPSRRNGVTRLERRSFVLRKRAERAAVEAGSSLYIASLSSRTITYKGMLTTDQLPLFFPDLRDERYESAIALVHSRFSTNTFPSWPLAHPFRFIAHNGEINTIKGNRNRMRAREAKLATELFDGPAGPASELGLDRIFPVTASDFSDSATFDEVLELLHLSGRSLPHAVLMMIPEAWENHDEMDPARRAFYRFHSSIMEPWDGPAAVCFTDGTLIGAVLDRNGLRPGRWWQTKDDLVVLASEVGVLDIPAADVVAKGRLQPGRMFLVDTASGRIVSDEEVKGALAAEHPYDDWLHAGLVHLPSLPERRRVAAQPRVRRPPADALRLHRGGAARPGDADGVLRRRADRLDGHRHPGRGAVGPLAAALRLLRPAVRPGDQPAAGRHPRGAGDQPRPHLRPGAEPAAGHARRPAGRCSCRSRSSTTTSWPRSCTSTTTATCPATPPSGSPATSTSTAAARRWPRRSSSCGPRSPRRSPPAPGSSCCPTATATRSARRSRRCCMTAAVHHHLVREKTRMEVGLVVESGDCREVHHVALLLGYGAAAVNPYLAFESIEDLIRDGALTGVEPGQAVRNMVKALGKGVLKVMSKMGISTVGSYTMAQIFEAVGLSQDLVDEYFTGTSCPLGGVGLDVLAEEVAMRHRRAYPENPTERAHRRLETGGEYQWRREGEVHLFNPETVFLLQHATRSRQYDVFEKYTQTVDQLSRGGRHPARAVHAARPACARRCRSTRSSRSARSSSGSPPAR